MKTVISVDTTSSHEARHTSVSITDGVRAGSSGIVNVARDTSDAELETILLVLATQARSSLAELRKEKP